MSRRVVLGIAALSAVAAGVGFLIHIQGLRVGPAPRPASGNVLHHGATGDGAADDTAAVQKAVDAGAGVVHFPPGTYRLTKPVVIDLDKVGFTAITGDGVARVVMAGEGPAFRFVGTHGGTAAPASVKDDVWERQRMPGVTGIEIVGAHAQAVGVAAAGTMKLTVHRVLIRKCLHGIHLTDRNRNVIVSDCHVYENRGVGVFLDRVNLHQINVTGSHVSYNRGGGIVCLGGEVRNLQITGCDVEANHDADGPPTANILVDSTGGTNAEVAVTGCTVQHTRAAPGSANIRIKGPTTPSPVTAERRDGHVTITGNVISDAIVGVHLDHARGVVVTGNTFWTGVEQNLLAEHSANVVVGPNNFDRNPRYGREEDGAADVVLFRDCTDCTLTGFQLMGSRKAAAGLTLERCSRFNVANLTVLDCDNCGVVLTDVTRSRVAGCVVRDDRPAAASLALKAAGGGGNVIADNVFGRPAEVAAGVGTVERNVTPKE